MATTISDAQVKELEALIRQNRPAVRPAATATVQAMGGGSFCSIWPTAKAALQALQGIIGTIPGVSVFAGAAIAIVIAAGDAAHGALCN